MTLPPDFWDDEEEYLWNELAPISAKIITAGGLAGSEMLPDVARLLINWDVFNQDAIDYLGKYRLSWVNGISETTRTRAIDAISEWIRAGEAMPVLEAKLAPLFSTQRAHQIAVTEVTRLYADGNQMAWAATGVVSGKTWMTANDEKVCFLCGPLHEQVVELDDIFIQTPSMIANSPQMQALYADAYDRALRRAESLLRWNGSYVGGPPRHSNCRCWLQPIVSEELFRESLRQMFGYFGDLEVDHAVAELRAWQPKISVVRY